MTWYIAPFLWYNAINNCECNPDLHPGMTVRGFKMKKVLICSFRVRTSFIQDPCGTCRRLRRASQGQFDKEEWDVRVVIPNYTCIPEKYRSQFEYVSTFLYGRRAVRAEDKYVGVLQYELDGITYYFIDNQEYFRLSSCHMGTSGYDIEKFCIF